MHLRILLPSALLLLSATASAQLITEAQGIALVKSAAKLAVKDFKAEAKGAQASLEIALDAVDDALAEDTLASTAVAGVGEALAAWLAACDTALFLAVDGVGGAISAALDDMGVPPGGDYPETFGYGTGGVLDKALVQIRKAAVSARSAAEKRARKTMALAEKKSGVAMSLTLQYPRALDLAAIETDDTDAGEVGAELELAVGGSRLDEDDDGVVFVAGNSDFDLPAVELALLDANGTLDIEGGTFLAGNFTFSGFLDGAGGGVPEGIFLVSVVQGGEPARAVLGISVR